MNERIWERQNIGPEQAGYDGRHARGYHGFHRGGRGEVMSGRDERGGYDERDCRGSNEERSWGSRPHSSFGRAPSNSHRGGGSWGQSWDGGRHQSSPRREESAPSWNNRDDGRFARGWRGESSHRDGEEFGGSGYDSRGEAWSSRRSRSSESHETASSNHGGFGRPSHGYAQSAPRMGSFGWAELDQPSVSPRRLSRGYSMTDRAQGSDSADGRERAHAYG